MTYRFIDYRLYLEGRSAVPPADDYRVTRAAGAHQREEYERLS